ncbi:DNA-processing protein DprA [candidate division KSB1 bacterium]
MLNGYSIVDLIHLCYIPSVGTYRIRKLINVFKTFKQLNDASVRELCRVDGFERATATQIRDGLKDPHIQSKAEKQLGKIKEFDAGVVTFWDEEYPENLRSIYNPPVLLFVRGKMPEKIDTSIAMVGSRVVSDYGRITAEKLSGDLSVKGITIISGMATGIDSYVHWGALKAGGSTVAVLGCGVDIVYPAENGALYRQIVEKGAVISEFPFGTKPSRGNFPSRNRIISGLSLGTVVVEAGKKSGALLTAAAALEQNREVFAVPGTIGNKYCEGSNRLIKDGAAKLVDCVDDIIDELSPKLKLMKNTGEPEEPQVPLTDDENSILTLITHEPVTVDHMVEKSNYTPSQTAGPLLTLELKGLIRRLPGNKYIRI